MQEQFSRQSLDIIPPFNYSMLTDQNAGSYVPDGCLKYASGLYCGAIRHIWKWSMYEQKIRIMSTAVDGGYVAGGLRQDGTFQKSL